MFELRPEGLKFLETAPLRLTYARTLPVTPETAFYALAAEPQSWTRWWVAVASNEYGGVGPHGEGSKRRVKLRGGVVFHETVIAWDSPSRYAYRVDRCTMPGLRALVEEWDVLETADGTRVSWTMGVDATPPLLTALRLSAPGVGFSATQALKQLGKQLSAR